MSALTRPPRSHTPALWRLGRQNVRGWDGGARFPYLPFLTTFVRRQELAPNRERGAYESLAWLPWLHRACPSATLDKQSVFSCSETIPKPGPRGPEPLCGALSIHHFRREFGRLGQIHEIVRRGVGSGHF